MAGKNKPTEVAFYKKLRFWIWIITILAIIFLLLWLDRTYFGIVLDKVSGSGSASVVVVG